ncbi:hypothetical protein WJX73_007359 [Symbiochloris irregularis]|uniref:Smr domain-containing protein n=1 Tax=Symbiochloris irregularis TaxID=706552 RepID=A0AAW1PLQ0_9CHLO
MPLNAFRNEHPLAVNQRLPDCPRHSPRNWLQTPNAFLPALSTRTRRDAVALLDRRAGAEWKRAAVSAEADSKQRVQRPASEASAAAPESTQVYLESLDLLEWPAVCRQVAAFTRCPTAAEVLLSSGLPLGKSQAESEEMLLQTAESQKLGLNVERIEDVRSWISAAVQEEETLSCGQLNAIAYLLQVGRKLKVHIQDQGGDSKYPALIRLAEGLKDTGANLNSSIRQAVQEQENALLDRASQALGRLRAERAQNLANLRQLANEWARDLHAKGISERSQVVIRRNRLCVPVRSARQGEVPKGSMRLGASTSGATLYLEPAPLVALNNAEARLADAVEAEEGRVLQYLTKTVAKHARVIGKVLTTLTSLDIVAARARHAEWLTAVPGGVRVAAVTGPNTGGKTAALKTLGLMALMAKAGLFLPLQWFGAVLADVGDSQDLQQSLSTFSGHVKRLGRILSAADRSSLVLLDEVGSGTDPNEGAALAEAVLSTLAERAGFTFATTHHASLNALAGRDERFTNASVEFNQHTLQPTYRLVWGTAGASHALAIAEGLKFDRNVIAEAHRIVEADGAAVQIGHSGKHAQAMQGSIKEDLATMQDRAAGAAESRQRAQRRLDQLQSEAQTLEEDAQSVQGKEAERKIASAVQQATKRLQTILHECKSGAITPQEARTRIAAVQAEARSAGDEAQQRLRSGMAGEQDADWVPAKGASIQIPSMGGALGQVQEVLGGGRLSVSVGQLSMQLGKDEVLPVQRREKKKPKAPKPAQTSKASKSESSKSEAGAPVAVQTSRNTVNVLGMRGDEAVEAFEDALAGLEPGLALFVVHGVGSGKLKARLLEVMKKHPMVERFEKEKGAEGASNSGCTVVFPRG